jgi:hypothetical protein
LLDATLDVDATALEEADPDSAAGQRPRDADARGPGSDDAQIGHDFSFL